jgi:hypothetical protein
MTLQCSVFSINHKNENRLVGNSQEGILQKNKNVNRVGTCFFYE